jgi:hypothetical protein
MALGTDRLDRLMIRLTLCKRKRAGAYQPLAEPTFSGNYQVVVGSVLLSWPSRILLLDIAWKA